MAGTGVIIPQNTIRFADCELNASAFELRRGRRLVKLERIPLQLMLILIEANGKVVTREAIADQIWGKDVFLDVDNGINTAIRKIRLVLNDDPQKPRFVETIAGRGYRFIAPLETAEAPPRPAELAPDRTPSVAVGTAPDLVSSAPKGSIVANRTLRWSRSGAIAVALLCVVGLAGWFTWKRVYGARHPIRSIAVIPLQNLSGDPSQDYFADGMTEELITELARIQSLRVISHTSVMDYKGTKKHLPQIAQELGVDAVLEGSVIRENSNVRVTVQLLDGPADRHLWGEEYERPLNGVLNLQRDVALAIAQEVRTKLGATQQAPRRVAYQVNPAAYDNYLKGRFYFDNGFTKPDSLKKAQQYFEAAIQADPKFAQAYAGLANTYTALAYTGVLTRDLAYRSAKDAADNAMELDDSVGEAHYTVADLKGQFEWDWAGAEREFDRAIALAPSYSCAHEARAGLLATLGRKEDALAEVAKIYQLDFGYGSAATETGVYYALRDYPRLIDASRRVLLLDPTDLYGHYNLAIGYEGTGRLQEAIPEYQKATAMADPHPVLGLARVYSALGRKAEAQKILRDLERTYKVRASDSTYAMASLYAGLGERERAFDYLDHAFRERSLELAGGLRADPAMDGLRGDPRFKTLASQMGLPSQ